jgi:hypothetical protein
MVYLGRIILAHMPLKWLVVCCVYLWVTLDGNRFLDLQSNQLTGSIPDSISTLTTVYL